MRYRTIYGGRAGARPFAAMADHVSIACERRTRGAHPYRRRPPACGSVVGWATCSAAFITI